MDFEIRESIFETEFYDSDSSFDTTIDSETVYLPKPQWAYEVEEKSKEYAETTVEKSLEVAENAEFVETYVNEMLDGSRLVEVSEEPTVGKLWVDITPESEEEVYTTVESDNKFTTKRLLTYDGSTIRLDGMIQTYSDLYDACMNRPDFVVLVYSDRAYHVNRVSNEQIVFITSYVSSGYVKMDRISISDDDVVTLTIGEAEMVVNKVGSITDANKTSTTKYPSVKAVNDLVEEIKHSGIAYDDTEVRADIAELQGYFTNGKANQLVVAKAASSYDRSLASATSAGSFAYHSSLTYNESAKSLKVNGNEVATSKDIGGIVGGDAWTSRTYTAGEFCIYNNKAWECVADTTNAPSESDTTHWKVVSLKNVTKTESYQGDSVTFIKRNGIVFCRLGGCRVIQEGLVLQIPDGFKPFDNSTFCYCQYRNAGFYQCVVQPTMSGELRGWYQNGTTEDVVRPDGQMYGVAIWISA